LFSVWVILFIPLFKELRNIVEIKDKKGKLIRMEKRGLNKTGKWVVFLFILTLVIGVIKVYRDIGYQNRFETMQGLLVDSVNTVRGAIYELKENANAQHTLDSLKFLEKSKRDSIFFMKISSTLAAQHLFLDTNFKLSKTPPSFLNMVGNTFVGNGKVPSVEIRLMNQPPKKSK